MSQASINQRRNHRKMAPPSFSARMAEALRYKCSFCRAHMSKVPLTLLWIPLWLIGFRQYYCVHCFEIRIRPTGWLRWLLSPFRMLFRFLSGR